MRNFEVSLPKSKPDLIGSNHGSIMLLEPVTPSGNEWLDANVSYDPDHQWFGGALVVEPRYFRALVEGAVADGLVVH